MKRTALAALVLLLPLAGCAAQEAPPETSPAEHAATEEPAATVEPVATPEPTPDLLAMCEVMGEDSAETFLGYPGYVLSISDGTLDLDEHAEYHDWATRMMELAPGNARTVLSKFTDPISQVQGAIDDGTGQIEFRTDDYKEGSLEILEMCVDAGYKVG